MPIKATCDCGQSLQAPDNLAGKRVKCPSCSQALLIPALSLEGADPLDLGDVASDPLKAPAPDYPPADDSTSYGTNGSWGQQPGQQIAARDPISEARRWASLIHFSVLAGFVIPVVGMIVPILIWQLKKSEFPQIDPHGVIVVNWLITLVIVGVALSIIGGAISWLIFQSVKSSGPLAILNYSLPLWFIWTFYPLGLAAAAIGIAFPIIGGIKAKNGEVWQYPISGQFLD